MDASWKPRTLETDSTNCAPDQRMTQSSDLSGSDASATYEARIRQVDLLGSEATLTRVEEKMADLKVDLLFYWDQVKLWSWRNRVLSFVLPHMAFKRDFLIIYGFNQLLQDDLPLIDFTLARSVNHLFRSPSRVFQHLIGLHYMAQGQSCWCDQCQNSLRILRRLLKTEPGVAVLARLAIHSNPGCRAGPYSLKEACMRRVEELGLGLDCLPVTVRQTIRAWPEEGLLKEGAQRMVQLLDTLVFEEMTFAVLEEDPQLIESPEVQNYVATRIKVNNDLVKQRILEEGQRDGRSPNPSSYLPTIRHHPKLPIIDDEIVFKHIEKGERRSYIEILGLDS